MTKIQPCQASLEQRICRLINEDPKLLEMIEELLEEAENADEQ